MEDEYEEEDDDEGMLLSIGEDGKAEMHKPEDFVQVEKKEIDIVMGFVEENKELFKEYVKKHKDTK